MIRLDTDLLVELDMPVDEVEHFHASVPRKGVLIADGSDPDPVDIARLVESGMNMLLLCARVLTSRAYTDLLAIVNPMSVAYNAEVAPMDKTLDREVKALTASGGAVVGGDFSAAFYAAHDAYNAATAPARRVLLTAVAEAAWRAMADPNNLRKEARRGR